MTRRHFVATFSGGEGSWAAARIISRENPDARLTLLFTDTNGEDPDLYRFLHEAAANVAANHPSPVELAYLDNDGQTIWDVFRKERMIGNTRLSVCSRALKQRPAREWLLANTDPANTTVVVGIDWTEVERCPSIERNHAPFPVVFPLVDHVEVTKDDVVAWLAREGIRRADLYGQGFDHNNCAGACVRAGQGQWVRLLEVNPERYAKEEAEEAAFRADLGKDVAILRDRSRTSIMARLGLTRDDVAQRPLEGTGRQEWYVRATGESLPTTLPLPLSMLRERNTKAPESIDRDDIGACGCYTTADDELDGPAPVSLGMPTVRATV